MSHLFLTTEGKNRLERYLNYRERHFLEQLIFYNNGTRSHNRFVTQTYPEDDRRIIIINQITVKTSDGVSEYMPEDEPYKVLNDFYCRTMHQVWMINTTYRSVTLLLSTTLTRQYNSQVIEVDLQDQRYRRYLIHIFVVLVFLAYLASANYIFSHLLTVDGEAEVHNINIPEETGNIRYYIDPIQIRQIEWKGIIAINGWAFIEGVDAYNYSTYILLKADTKEYVFDTSMEMRPDITQHFAGSAIRSR